MQDIKKLKKKEEKKIDPKFEVMANDTLRWDLIAIIAISRDYNSSTKQF